MQITGLTCRKCQDKILLKREGTWCARCWSPLCIVCAAPETVCPGCGERWDDPANHFVFSEMCPACFTPVEREEQCPWCAAPTRWDDSAAYAEYRQRLAHESTVARPVAIFQILGGISLIVVVTVVPIALMREGSPIAPWWYGAYFVAFGLFTTAVRKLRRAGRLERFK